MHTSSPRPWLIATLALLAAALPATARGQEREAMELTLAEAMRIAFQNNLDIRVVGFDRRLAEEQVTTAGGAFEPVFSVGIPGASNLLGAPVNAGFGGGAGAGGFGYSDARNPSSTALAGAAVAKTRGYAGFLDLGQTLPMGLRYDVGYSFSRTTTNSLFQSLNPAWDSTLQVTVSQPLLRGRGEAAAATELLLARANTDVSEAAFRARVESVLLEVERAYWELVFAERDLEVKGSSLELAHEQLERTRAQVEVGLMAPVEETQAEVQVAARETDLIVARNALENARDALRALLRADNLPGGWDTGIRPADDPEQARATPELDRAIALAMESRPEVAQGLAAVASRGVEVAAARNGLLPRADLVAQLSTNGIGGDLIVRDGFPGEVVEVVPGGFGDALDQMTGLDFVSWRLGLNVSLPIGNSAAEGLHAQATINEDRAATELERTRQQVVLEVRQTWRGVRTAAEAVQSIRKTRELAERQLEIETDRFEVGMSTNFEVLQFQEDLTAARSAELRALIDQRIAETQLQRAMGLLLQRYGIAVR